MNKKIPIKRNNYVIFRDGAAPDPNSRGNHPNLGPLAQFVCCQVSIKRLVLHGGNKLSR